MDNNRDKIKDLFSSKLSSFEPTGPVPAWGELDQILSKHPALDKSQPKQSTLKVKLLRIAGVAACLVAIVSVAAAIISFPIDDVLEVPEPLIAKVDVPAKKEIIQNSEPVIRRSHARVRKIEVVEEQIVEEQIVLQPEIIVKKRTSLYAKPRVSEIYYVSEDGLVEKETVTRRKISKGGLYTLSTSEIEARARAEASAESKAADVKSSNSGRFNVGVVAGLGLLSSNKTQKATMLFSDKLVQEAHPDAYSSLNNYKGDYKLNHDIPISFGLTFSKNVSPQLAVSTGLIYTYLSSSIKSTNTVYVNEEQSFNYLGIPLSLDYTFANVGKAQFYGSLGVFAQKDFHGSYKSSFSYPLDNHGGSEPLEYSPEYYLKESIHQSKIQFSGFLKVGVAYPIYQSLYMYGNIGGSYYFDANNKYRTIYSDKKTQLDFNLGFRYGF